MILFGTAKSIIIRHEINMQMKKNSQLVPMDLFEPFVDARHVVLVVARKNPYSLPFLVLRQANVASAREVQYNFQSRDWKNLIQRTRYKK